MEIDDLKDRYKVLPMWARILIAVTFGVLPGIYVYVDEGQVLEEALVEAESQEEAARIGFEAARKKKEEIPKLEAELIFTEEQLIKAKSKLPDSYRIEEILRDAAKVAKQTGVKFKNFKPGDERVRQEVYPFVELPIQTEVEGSFNQIASFLDIMVHLEGSIFIRQLELVRLEGKEKQEAVDPGTVITYEQAKTARQNVKVNAKFDVVVYRGVGPKDQLASPEDPNSPSESDGKVKKPNDEGQKEAGLEDRGRKVVM